MTGTAHIEVLIATGNEGKIREIKQALHGLPLAFRLLNDFPELRFVNEVGATYEENAKLKALDYSRQTSTYTLADDSGLEVEALGRLPGLHSAAMEVLECLIQRESSDC
jgi:XTP/dITP diphosphohydrolase